MRLLSSVLCLLVFLSSLQGVLSDLDITPINRDSPIPDYSKGQSSDPYAPYYLNRYKTMTLNYFNGAVPSTQRSPVQTDSANMPNRCPSGNYNNTQDVTILEITPDITHVACVPNSAATTADNDPTGQSQPPLDYSKPNMCIQRRLSFKGISGPMLRTISGIETLVMKECDIFNLRYINRLDRKDIWGKALNEPEIIHAHGMTPPYWFDGVPYVQISGANGQLIQPGGQTDVKYTNPPYQESGTYFIHSHFNFHHDDGVGMPLLLTGMPPQGYPTVEYNKLAYLEQIDPDHTGLTDIIMYFEDFCPIAYNEGAPPAGSTCAPAMHAYFALATEWQQSAGVFSPIQCQPIGTGMDIDYTNHLCNNRSAENAWTQQVTPGQTYHIRAINSAGMSNYLLTFDGLVGTVVATDGNWIVPKNVTSYWMAVAQRLDILITIPADAADGTQYRLMGYAEGTMYQAGVILYVGMNPPKNQTVTLGPQFDSNGVYVWGTGARWYQDEYVRPLDDRSWDADRPVPWLDHNVFAGMAGDMGMYDNTALEATQVAWYGLKPKKVDRFYELDITGNNGFKSFNLVAFQLPPMVDAKTLTYPNGQQFDPQSGLQNPPILPRPLYVVAGERVCIKIISHNTDAHAIHLHGHTFQITEIDGVSLGDENTGYGGARRDVVLTPRGQCRDVTFCFDADNAHGGKHPLHCHMQYHMMAGMFTTVEYVTAEEIDALEAAQSNLVQADANNILGLGKSAALRGAFPSLCAGVFGALLAVIRRFAQ